MTRPFFLSLLFFFSLGLTAAFAQVDASPQAEAARKDLIARGIDDKEVEKRLRARGFDPANLRPEQIPALQKATEEIIREIEKEKGKAGLNAPDKLPDAQRLPQTSPEALRLENAAKKTGKSANELLEKTDIKIAAGVAPGEAVTEVIKAATLDQLPTATIFGQSIFRDKRLDIYRQTNEINVPDSYQLGPGDKLGISIWGQAVFNGSFEIAREGHIQPEGMSRIFLKGKTFAQAKRQLEDEFARRYPFSKGNFDVTLLASRTLTVNITGEVFQYGTFRLLALNSAFNAMVAAGGPTDIGSVRNIQLIHQSGKRDRIDMYEYLLNPAAFVSYTLEDGDNLFIPVVERLVSIQGSINRPFKYELVNGENLLALVKYAAGLSENASSKNVEVRRFESEKEVLINVDLDDLKKNGRDFDLKHGDRITVKRITQAVENFVLVTGAVHVSSNFELVPGMKIGDVLKKAVLKREARTDYGWLLRPNVDGTFRSISIGIGEILANPASPANLELQPRDQIQVFNKERFADKNLIKVMGAVRNQDSIPFDPAGTQRVSDLLIVAGGLKSDAYNIGYLIGSDVTNHTRSNYRRVNLRKASENPASPENLFVQAGDELRVFSTQDLFDTTTVNVDGAVREPGEFIWDETLTLQDAILLSGGMKLEASSNRVEVFRLELNDNQPTKTSVATFQVNKNNELLGAEGFQLKPFDLVVVRTVPNFEFQQVVVLMGEVVYPGPYALTSKNERLTDLVQRAGGLSPEAFPEGATLFRSLDRVGFVVMQLDQAMRNPSDKHNFELRDQDTIVIPKRKDFVGIQGETNARELYPQQILGPNALINVAYTPGKRANFYVNGYAAGVGERGSRKLVTVQDPNGEIHRTKNFGLFKRYPKVQKGSIVTVGAKPEKKPELFAQPEEKKEKTDWGKIFGESLAQATGVLSLILLVQQISK